MKELSNPFKKSLLVIIASLTTLLLFAQDKKDKAAIIKNIIEAKTYVFIAQSALPSSGQLRQLTLGYQLDVHGDTAQADLPYFGRAYTAPIDPSKGGIQFTSTDFDYSIKEKKKGGWSILIKPKENVDVSQLNLDVSTDGYASLQVTSKSRQPISFSGYVAQRKKK